MQDELFKPLKEAVKHWYLPLISGIIFILIGFWTFKHPAASYLGLSLLFSISFLTSGMLEVIFSIANRKQLDNWGWNLVMGILTALIGIILLAHPEISLISLSLYIGFLLMFRSTGGLGIALDMKSYGIANWWVLLILGILGTVLSCMLILNPAFGGMSIVIWTGMALLVGGTLNLFLGFKMRKAHKNWDSVSDELKTQFHELENQIKSEITEISQ